MRGYELTERAVRDISIAREWYDRENLDLGNRCVDAILAAVRIARERPNSLPEVEDGARRILCEHFPLHVYFEVVSEDRIRVLAVYHAARDPRRWRDDDRI